MRDIGQSLFSRGDTTLQYGLIGNVVVLVLVVVGVLGTVLLVGSYRAINAVSERAIEQAGQRMQAEVSGVFSPIEMQGHVIREWGRNGELTLADDQVETLNARFRPLIERNEHLSAMALADAKGREYVAWQDGNTWVSRYSYADSEEERDPLWQRWDEAGQPLESWHAEREEDSRLRPWFQGAVAAGDGDDFWSEPFSFFMTDEPGITYSTRFDVAATDEFQVLSLGVSLAAISEITTASRPTPNGFVAVMTGNGELVGLPASNRYSDRAQIRADVLSHWTDLELHTLGEGWEQWRQRDDRQPSVSARSDDMGRYRAGFEPFILGDQQLVLATVVPRSDLTGAVDRQRNIAIILSLLAIGLAIAIGRRSARRYQERLTEVYDEAREFGQYHLEHKLGVGGMGEVYRAEHAMLRRPTAVKLLKPDQYDERSIKRFEREVRLSCRLTHPNTVTIFDYGRTDDGLFYYAMELLDGVTLRSLSKFAGPLDQGRVISLMRQICGALTEAHGIGLIHRDIKLSNIMIGTEGGLADRITVLDFGLVKEINAEGDTQLTNQDYLHGSPGFMAPEVILGESASSAAVDIYAVGVVAYSLLCGENPFTGNSPVEIMMNQVESQPIRPSELLDREVDEELEALIMKCMSLEPERRPSSIEEVRRELIAMTSRFEWTVEDAYQWWEEYEQSLVPKHEPAPAEYTDAAFSATLTNRSRKEQLATLEDAPEPVIDAAPTLDEVARD